MTANLEAAAKAIPPGSACSAADRLPGDYFIDRVDVYDFSNMSSVSGAMCQFYFKVHLVQTAQVAELNFTAV
jgi:hypothetical protein